MSLLAGPDAFERRWAGQGEFDDDAADRVGPPPGIELRMVPAVLGAWTTAALGHGAAWLPTVVFAVAAALSWWVPRARSLAGWLTLGACVAALAWARGLTSRAGDGVDVAFGSWDGLRARFAETASGISGETGALLAGMSVGETSHIPAERVEQMRDSGLSHLTAVSGANVAIAMSAALGLAALFGAHRRVRLAASLAGLAGFVAVAPTEPTVLRAGAMAATVLVARAASRPSTGVGVLALVATVLILAEPGLASDLSFALSVLATLGILVFAPPVAVGLARWLPRRLAEAVSLPVAALVACQPLLVVLGQQLMLGAIVANLLVAPVVAPITVLGLIGAVTSPLGADAAALAVVPGAWLTRWVLAVAQWTSNHPLVIVPWPRGASGVWAMAACTSALLAAGYLAHRGRGAGRRVRLVLVVSASLAAAAAVGAAVGERVGVAVDVPRDWAMVGCDVGQGDAWLIRGEAGTIMVDTGPDPDLVGECLATLGVEHLDAVFLTHFDHDHVGGVEGVLARASVGRVWASPGEDDPGRSAKTLDLVLRAGVPVEFPVAGASGLAGDVAWRVLWPQEGVPGLTANGASLVLDVRVRGLRVLTLGDTDAIAHRRLAAEVGGVDLLTLAHHGSAEFGEELYRAVSPRVALVSVGAENRYGHPTSAALSAVESVGARVLRTDRQGMVAVAPGADGGMLLWCERGCAEAGDRDDAVAEHTELDDVAQTVTVEEQASPDVQTTDEAQNDETNPGDDTDHLAATGADLPWVGAGMAGLLLLAGAAMLVARRMRVEE